MLKYLSKFVLEALPSIVATVIGAYIVAHYINPKTSDAPKAAVASTESRGTVASAKSADLKSTDLKPADVQTGEGKAGEGKVTRAKLEEPAASAGSEAAGASSARTAERTPEKAEKKDAASLARAAIERLRGPDRGGRSPPESRPVAESARAEPQEPALAQPQRVQAAAVATAPAIPAAVATTPVTAAPPLPPPVIVAAPNFGRRSTEEAGLQPSPEATGSTESRSGDSARLIPPADIPAASPDTPLQAQAAAVPAPGEQVSLADHFLSTTKSFFRALTPHP